MRGERMDAGRGSSHHASEAKALSGKSAMVSNPMVVLCGQSGVHPVVNTGAPTHGSILCEAVGYGSPHATVERGPGQAVPGE